MTRSRINRYIMEQEALPEITRESLDAMQLRKLNALLRREHARGSFYKGLPEHLDSLDDLRSLPFTTEEDLAQNAPGLLLCSQAEVQRVLSDATSGTTGAAKRVFYTEGDCESTVKLFMAGLGELIFPGSVTMICFPFSGPFGLGDLIAEAVTRLGAKPLKLGAGLSYGELLDVLDRDKPDTFVGMPVQLLSLLRACGRGSLRRALVSGDACPDSVLDACEAILGSRLFPHYGSREMALGGAICCPAHEGMHLRENHVIAEIIGEDSCPLPHGELGELVITTIGMEAMPLIRYRTGDYTRILPEPCPCGSAVLRLDRVRRRSKELSAQALDEIMFSNDRIVDCRYKISDAELKVEALTAGDYLGDALRPRLKALVKSQTITISARPVSREDRALYAGKRVLLKG